MENINRYIIGNSVLAYPQATRFSFHVEWLKVIWVVRCHKFTSLAVFSSVIYCYVAVLNWFGYVFCYPTVKQILLYKYTYGVR